MPINQDNLILYIIAFWSIIYLLELVAWIREKTVDKKKLIKWHAKQVEKLKDKMIEEARREGRHMIDL